MSETVKNTLFRFVTLRSPELVPEKDKADYHIHHPNPSAEGFFSSQLANPAATPAQQAAALKQRAESFNALNNTGDLKNLTGTGLFNFSVWLAKNRNAIFKKENLVYPDGLPAAVSHATLIAVWDNLFYQLITGKKPQLRQQLIEVLVANGYLLSLETPYQHQLAEARVVIPSSFFGGEGQAVANRAVAASSATSNDVSVYTGDLKLIAKSVAAGEKIKAYEQVLEELRRAEKKYNSVNGAAYDAARKSYDQQVKEAIDNYYKNGGGAEAAALEAETDPAASSPSTGPEIPAFEFTPAPEMSSDLLQQFLSSKSLFLVQQLGLVGNSSFAEAAGKINEGISDLSKDVVANDDKGEKSVVINGVLLPVNERILPVQEQFSFYMMPVHRGGNNYSILATINMGQPGNHVKSCLYHAQFSSGNNTNGAFNETAQGNALSVEFYPVNGLPVPGGVTDFRFYGELSLVNGPTLLFDTMFNLYEGASGIMETEGEEQGGGEIGIEAPSGYGIRRIGVADYRKVEQSVCCYVPGEVSHIENIMAREYKERSNRRLSRMEDTTTLERSMEKETQKDTSTSERFELQKEVNSVVSQQTSNDSHANVHGDFKGIGYDAGASFAFNTSKEDSNRNAVNYSKEVTEKALERVVQKVREERTIKIVEEFEEQNKHGFDNRQGDKHVSGVYRWIDKVYKNQVHNYGKRLMYEFMVPQPAVFHNEAVKIAANLSTTTIIEKPVDPRKKEGLLNLGNHTRVNAWTFPYWAGIYNADLKSAPDEVITVSQAFDFNGKETGGDPFAGSKSFKMELPDGYEATVIKVGVSYVLNKSGNGSPTPFSNVRVANSAGIYIGGSQSSGDKSIELDLLRIGIPIRNEIGISAEGRNLGGLGINVTVTCRPTAESYQKWQIESFNAIIESFNQKLDEYNKAMEVLKAKPVDPTSKEINPGFYRQVENTVLRKNCISYMVTHENMGNQRYYSQGGSADIKPLNTEQMDKYSALVKFMEQAFEWEVMSYKFYPFYWGFKGDWQQMYQQEVSDTLFRSFLQAGMARVIVSVRPGFEEAVMYFMATGKIWNGGAVPAIGDDLYLSIVEELKNPEFYIDETWETRVPTTLNAIQSGSIALNTEGLPCDCGTANSIVQGNDKLGVVLPPPSNN